jgi:hypothetical protein
VNYAIELLDSEGQVVAGPQDLLTLAVPFLGGLPGGNLHGSRILLLLLTVPGEDNDLPGEPYLSYQSPAIGYVRVVVENGGRMLYRHPHTLGEVVGEGIRQWLGQLSTSQAPAGYRLTGPSRIDLNSHPAPMVEGVTEIQPYAEGEQPAFRIRPLPPPTPAPRRLASFGAQPVEPDWPAPGRTDFVKVLVEQPVYDELTQSRIFSTEVEDGGFLVGQVYEDEDQPGTYLARVTGALPALQTGASFLHFTFTGDSFRQVKQVLDRDRPGEQLLGWYHTHLFSATTEIGLSSIDFRLHFTTFRLPWQLAGLINLHEGERVLRFYVRRHDTMALCPHQPLPGGGMVA